MRRPPRTTHNRKAPHENRTHKRLAWLAGITLLTTATIIGITTTASNAHANTVQGQAVCNPDTGQFDLTWTITNDHPLPEKATSRLGKVDIPASGTGQQSETVDAGTYELVVHGKWSDGFKGNASGSVTTAGECVVTPPPPVDVCPNLPGDQPAGTDCAPVTEEPPTEEPPVVTPPKVNPPKDVVPPKVTTHTQDEGLPNTGA